MNEVLEPGLDGAWQDHGGLVGEGRGRHEGRVCGKRAMRAMLVMLVMQEVVRMQCKRWVLDR